jgi:hypothetical protein
MSPPRCFKIRVSAVISPTDTSILVIRTTESFVDIGRTTDAKIEAKSTVITTINIVPTTGDCAFCIE